MSTAWSYVFGTFFYVLFPIYYVYIVVFQLKKTAIQTLVNMYIYKDKDFTGWKEEIYHDWDSLNYGKFFGSKAGFLAVKKEFAFIFGLPFLAGLFGIFLFGNVPNKNFTESHHNIMIWMGVVICYYAFGVVVMCYHLFQFDNYKTQASQDKNLREVQNILRP